MFAPPGLWLVVDAHSQPFSLQCPAPATTRCAGVNTTTGELMCGKGYEGYACSSCAVDYFPRADGSCGKCPPDVRGDTLQLALPFLYYAGGVLTVGIVNGVLVLIATKLYGGTLKGGLRRSVAFIVYLVTVLQVIATAAQSARDGLPSFLANLYQYITLTRLEVKTAVHPSCVGSMSPWTQSTVVFSLSLGVWLCAVSVAVYGLRRERKLAALSLRPAAVVDDEDSPAAATPQAGGGGSPRKSLAVRTASGSAASNAPTSAATSARPLPVQPLKVWQARLLKLLLVLAALLYATAASHTLSALHCDATTVTVDGYFTLSGDGSSMAAAGLQPLPANGTVRTPDNRLLTVHVLNANPFVVCWEGAHRGVAAFAVAVLVLFVIAYPALTAVFVVCRMRQILASPAVRPEWQQAVASYAAARNTYLRSPGNKVLRWLEVAACGVPRHALAVAASRKSFAGAPALSRKSLQTVTANPLVARQQLAQTPDVAGKTGSAVAQGSIAASVRPCDVIDACPVLLQDSLVSRFVAGDYRASEYFFRQLDEAWLLLLSLVSAYLQSPQTAQQAALQAGLTFAILVAAAASIVWRQPFVALDGWKHHVKVASLLVATLVTAVTLAQFLDADAGGVGSAHGAYVALVYVTFIANVALLACLVVAFWMYVLRRGAVVEQLGRDLHDPARCSPAGLRQYAADLAAGNVGAAAAATTLQAASAALDAAAVHRRRRSTARQTVASPQPSSPAAGSPARALLSVDPPRALRRGFAPVSVVPNAAASVAGRHPRAQPVPSPPRPSADAASSLRARSSLAPLASLEGRAPRMSRVSRSDIHVADAPDDVQPRMPPVPYRASTVAIPPVSSASPATSLVIHHRPSVAAPGAAGQVSFAAQALRRASAVPSAGALVVNARKPLAASMRRI